LQCVGVSQFNIEFGRKLGSINLQVNNKFLKNSFVFLKLFFLVFLLQFIYRILFYFFLFSHYFTWFRLNFKYIFVMLHGFLEEALQLFLRKTFCHGYKWALL
jgi:hypothetical protein